MRDERFSKPILYATFGAVGKWWNWTR